ncbi:metallophosphoesterase [Halobacteriovorax sp. RT-2-4]|uniref:metallophosphoesterase n=1 Tax=unclassified Halobacteriovorax TaxID=2639665 RepID=UPI00399B5DB6
MNKKLAFLLILFVIGLYSFYYCPSDLEISHYNRKYNDGKTTLKIAHISDLHTKGLGTIEKKVISALQKEKPDIIVITGDLATPDGTYEGYLEVLREMKAPKGVYFVQGNWDIWEELPNKEELFQKAGIIDLTNSMKQIDKDLNLIGFDDLIGVPATKLLKSVDSSLLNIALFHTPDFFDTIPNSIPLSLAGHSHGGQVRIPLYGPLWTPYGTDNYISGWYKKENKELFVSRGIGNSILPIRFNCRPELVFIEIRY